MTKLEAIKLLAACAPLAEKLAIKGVQIELTRAEQNALRGFKRINQEGSKWLGDAEVYTAAGMNTSLLALLDFKNRLEISKELKHNNHNHLAR